MTDSPQRLDQIDPRPTQDGGYVYGVSLQTGGDASFVLGIPQGIATLGADGLLEAAQRPPGSGGDSFVPTHIAAGETFTVPVNKQALYALPIVVDGTLVIDGTLVEVA